MVVTMLVTTDIFLQWVVGDSIVFDPFVEIVIEACIPAGATATLLWFVLLAPLRQQGQRQLFETKLHRALEMAGDESSTYLTVGRALEQEFGHLSAELLLADSSDAHLKQAVATGQDGRGPGCQVTGPSGCPAVRNAQTLLFASSEGFEACPYLQGRPQGVIAAACVPVSVGGRTIGVLHATTPSSERSLRDDAAHLEVVAGEAGARIGLLRVMEKTQLQAATDPLTGLLNRRAFENQAQELLARQRPFALAMGDLDHFKILNDTHGHEAGDRALRQFSRTLSDAVRTGDLVSRMGGEEFVIAFPDLSVTDAAAALERVRAQLQQTLAEGSLPTFTVSFGVAHSSGASTLEELYRVADAALFRAKREGRDRVVVDGAGMIDGSVARDERESPAAA